MTTRRKQLRDLPAHPHLKLERACWAQGIRTVAGIDEAGRGAWAGPVVAAAVILPRNHAGLGKALNGVTDSKKLSPARREAFLPLIYEVALAVGVGSAGPTEIDKQGLIPATRAAMERAVAMMATAPEHLLIDAVDLRAVIDLPQQAMFYGDSISLSIAAASIVAKVTRDRLMRERDAHYPHYGFARHKGYGTVAHRQALHRWGPCELHRQSFRPIAALRYRQLDFEQTPHLRNHS